jgi:hypothetical protein
MEMPMQLLNANAVVSIPTPLNTAAAAACTATAIIGEQPLLLLLPVLLLLVAAATAAGQLPHLVTAHFLMPVDQELTHHELVRVHHIQQLPANSM